MEGLVAISLRNIRILGKIALPATILAVVSGGITWYGTSAVQQLAATAARLVDRSAARVEAALQAESAFANAAVSEKNVILFAGDTAQAKAQIESYRSEMSSVEHAIERLRALTDAADKRALIDDFAGAVHHRFESSERVFELTAERKIDEAALLSVGDGARLRRAATEAITRLIELYEVDMQAARDQSLAEAERTFWILSTSSIAGLVCAFGLLAWIAVYFIARPLGGMTGQMTRVAAGDLDITVPDADRRDEVGALARSLAVFKDNALRARKLEAEQHAEQQRKEQRQRAVEGFIATFDHSVTQALQTLTTAADEMRVTAEAMSSIAEETSRQGCAGGPAGAEAASHMRPRSPPPAKRPLRTSRRLPWPPRSCRRRSPRSADKSPARRISPARRSPRPAAPTKRSTA
jgi:methyl-accepting chemotaxis protein